MRHAAKSGAQVIEEVKVTELHFAPDNDKRPVAASWTSGSQSGRIDFEWLVDASGRNGIMSTKYLRNRRFNQSLHNVACWGYYEGAGRYKPGTPREHAVWIEAMTGAPTLLSLSPSLSPSR